MFKAFANTMFKLGKRAIGYIKGMNGNKLAMLASSLVSKKYPGAGPIVTPALMYAGRKLNDLMDYLANDNEEQSQRRIQGGVYKPMPRIKERRYSESAS